MTSHSNRVACSVQCREELERERVNRRQYRYCFPFQGKCVFFTYTDIAFHAKFCVNIAFLELPTHFAEHLRTPTLLVRVQYTFHMHAKGTFYNRTKVEFSQTQLYD